MRSQAEHGKEGTPAFRPGQLSNYTNNPRTDSLRWIRLIA
jgi:hypothetical protein